MVVPPSTLMQPIADTLSALALCMDLGLEARIGTAATCGAVKMVDTEVVAAFAFITNVTVVDASNSSSSFPYATPVHIGLLVERGTMACWDLINTGDAHQTKTPPYP